MVLTPHLHRKKPTGSCCFQDFLRVPQRPYKWVSLWQDVFLHEKHINLAWHTTSPTDLRSETVPTSIHVALLQLLGSSFEKNAKKAVDLLPMPQKDGEEKIHYHSESYRQLPPNNCLAPKTPCACTFNRLGSAKLSLGNKSSTSQLFFVAAIKGALTSLSWRGAALKLPG